MSSNAYQKRSRCGPSITWHWWCATALWGTSVSTSESVCILRVCQNWLQFKQLLSLPTRLGFRWSGVQGVVIKMVGADSVRKGVVRSHQFLLTWPWNILEGYQSAGWEITHTGNRTQPYYRVQQVLEYLSHPEPILALVTSISKRVLVSHE
jgi:hypothetical protein